MPSHRLRLDRVTPEEWKRFATQTARRLIHIDGRSRKIGDYQHRRLALRFGQKLPPRQHQLRLHWLNRVDEKIKKMKTAQRRRRHL